ncbi:MAG: TonB-dependent receptor [Woeseiaceae bacterium]|nr:TonB-dependent receptor [Woeseiaceae bacterium]
MSSTPKVFRFLIPAAALVFAMPVLSPVALAQAPAAEEIEEIITTGTRRSERSASDSAVPIDVIGGQELVNIGTTDLNELLRNTVPSYNVQSHSIDDAATLVRPATMRGLPPDNVLIMVNGKRRHRSGVIAELGSSLNEGSQGADIAAIPALAIKQVEVLRDGAAAQYGSDAIAGVINFVLDDSAQGTTLEARTGEFMEGDGTLLQLSGNTGIALGDSGFLNLTGVWSEQDPTSRSLQRADADSLGRLGAPDQLYGATAGTGGVRQPYAQIWGQPETRDNWNIFGNMGIQVSESMEVYAFGNYGKRETEGGFFYRNPNNRGGTYTNGGVRAVVDTRIGGPASDPLSVPLGTTGYVSNCPALPSPGGTVDASDAAAVAADYTARQNLPANCWLMNSIVPGGYTPQFGGQLQDASIVGGIRGEMTERLSYDFSGGYGRNKVDFFLNNTWNPSLGPDAITDGQLKRDFELGAYVQSEVNLNADFVYALPVDAFASDLSFAFGAEYRDEIFETILGEVDSWQAGRFAFQSSNGANFYNDGTTRLADLSIGAHGFAGFSPQQAGLWGRSNIAVYAEAEADLTDRLTGSVAVRYEDFESFGDTTNYKVAGRFAITDAFAIRGSVNSGFRAPTPGQENVTKVSTILVNGELSQSGQIPPTNPLAVALGGGPLGPEESVGYSAGFVWDISDQLNLTVDYFNINVDDRIAFTGSIDITAEDPNDPQYADLDCPNAKANPVGTLALCLQEVGVPGAADLSSVTFYTNDFETTTQGVDVVLAWDMEWGGAGSGTLTGAVNWTETEVDNAGSEVSRDKVVDLENQNPEYRGVLTYNHYFENFSFLVRASYYDDWVNSQIGGGDTTPRGPDGTGYTIACAVDNSGGDDCYDGDIIFDIEAAYTFAERFTVAVGADNVLDEEGAVDIQSRSDLDPNLSVGAGNHYSDTTPWGIDGGFWYVRLTANFD